MKRVRGVSLVEMLTAIVIATLVMTSLSRTVVAGINFQKNGETARIAEARRVAFEDHLKAIIEGAVLYTPDHFFISPIPNNVSAPVTDTSGITLAEGSDSLVLTSVPTTMPGAFLHSTDTVFEDLNQRFGPLAGPAEIGLSTTPVGEAGLAQGLFLRTQTPPDSDPTQGGTETLMMDRLQAIRFQFYDGTQWDDSWDTRNGNKGQLPMAVKVTYYLLNDPMTHTILVRVPMGTTASSNNSNGSNGSSNSSGSNNSGSSGSSNGQGNPSGAGSSGAPAGGQQP